MGLQALWSLGLACLDGYALKVNRDLNNAVLVSLFVVGDWVIIKVHFETFIRQSVCLLLAFFSFFLKCAPLSRNNIQYMISILF
jgi:hypothetical protein